MLKVQVSFLPQSFAIERATLVRYLMLNDPTFTGLDGLTDEQLLARITSCFDALQAISEFYVLAVDAEKLTLAP